MKTHLTALLLLASLSAWSAEKNAAVIAIEYPPFVSQAEPNGGISTGLLKEKLERAGWSYAISFYSPLRAHHETEQQDWLLSFYPPSGDINASAILLGEAKIYYGLFRNKQQGEFAWRDLAELKGKTVATIRSQTTSSGQDQETFLQAGMKVVFIDTIDQAVLMLNSRRIDFLLTADATGWYYINKNQLDAANFEFSSQYFREYPHMIYYNPQHPAIKQLLSDLQQADEYNGLGTYKGFVDQKPNPLP